MFWISQLKNSDTKDMAFRQHLIHTFVNANCLYNDRMVLTYNYKDGTKAIILEQTEKAFDIGENGGSDLINRISQKKIIRTR